jgi:hypothetical protein
MLTRGEPNFLLCSGVIGNEWEKQDDEAAISIPHTLERERKTSKKQLKTAMGLRGRHSETSKPHGSKNTLEKYLKKKNFDNIIYYLLSSIFMKGNHQTTTHTSNALSMHSAPL